MHDLKTLDKTYIANTYARFPVEIVAGHGSTLTDAEGKVYIDMGSGIAVNAFGIGDPAWKQAVTAQLDRVQHTSNLYYTREVAELEQLLRQKGAEEELIAPICGFAGVYRPMLAAAWDYMNRAWGGSVGYLTGACGVTEAELDAIRRRYIED